MTEPTRDPGSGFGPRRLLWLLAIKIVLIAFAVWIALRLYGFA